MKIDILVLNYNGKYLLAKFLPSIVRAAGRSMHDCKVMVVDNLSTDGSAELVKKEFPSVGFFASAENKVLCSYNDVIRDLNSDVVMLLNNDIEVAEDFVDYLAGHFEKDDVFFVAPRLLNFDGTYNGGRSYLRFKFGIVKNVVDIEMAELPGETDSNRRF
jgi:GT2 family glycosyltransferase